MTTPADVLISMPRGLVAGVPSPLGKLAKSAVGEVNSVGGVLALESREGAMADSSGKG
jgi:hypothetical protein